MDQLTFNDIILFLLTERRPRQHERNLRLFRTLFERDDARLSLQFNILAGLGAALVISWISNLLSGSYSINNTGFNFILPIIMTLLVALYLFVIGRQHSQLRRDYIDLIRLYYYLDRILP